MTEFSKLHAARADTDAFKAWNELQHLQVMMQKAISAYFQRPETGEAKLDDIIKGCKELPETIIYLAYQSASFMKAASGAESRMRRLIIRNTIRDAFISYLFQKDAK
jgi:hypothetical protein